MKNRGTGAIASVKSLATKVGAATSCVFALVIALFGLVSAGASPAVAASEERVLLISIDGAGRDVVDELLAWQKVGDTPYPCPAKRRPATMPVPCGDNLTCLPTLCRYQMIQSDVGDGKPLTRPQHAQMLSGYGPDITGIVRNSGSNRMPPGYTLYERLTHYFGDEGITTVHIAGRKFVGRGIIGHADYVGAVDINMRRGGPDKRTGRATTARAFPLISQVAGGPFFMFVHYKESDVTGHSGGSRSAAYREALISLDQQIGELESGLASAGILDSTQILVTPDHGFWKRFHVGRVESTVQTWIASRQPILLQTQGNVIDIVPTILDLYGIPTEGINPPLPGKSLVMAEMLEAGETRPEPSRRDNGWPGWVNAIFGGWLLPTPADARQQR